MKKVLQILLIVLITVIVIVAAVFAYVLIKNPLGLGDVIKGAIVKQDTPIDANDYKDYDHPLLTDEQQARLVKTGIDVKKLPTEITPEQQKCSINKLGQDRITEIMKGAEPTPLEILKVMPCL